MTTIALIVCASGRRAVRRSIPNITCASDKVLSQGSDFVITDLPLIERGTLAMFRLLMFIGTHPNCVGDISI